MNHETATRTTASNDALRAIDTKMSGVATCMSAVGTRVNARLQTTATRVYERVATRSRLHLVLAVAASTFTYVHASTLPLFGIPFQTLSQHSQISEYEP